ncbi:vitamin K epoxide reductase family protein [Lysinibacillus fusiformis]|nr:vitamin K epoxide reductase family protein [Lysinibacillus fusiformis]
MDQIRNAINNVYKTGKFSDENRAKVFQNIQQKRKPPLTPILLTVLLSACLLLGLNMLLFQHDIDNIFQSHTATVVDSDLYPEKSGKVKDFSVLMQPWMIVGIIGIVVLFIFALYALTKKWLWRALLCVIIIIAILGNMSERIGYLFYVKNEADIIKTMQSGVLPIGNAEDILLNDTITIHQYRMSYFTTGDIRGIAIFQHDGKGFKLEHADLSTQHNMQSIHVPDIRRIIIPILEGHAYEQLVIQINTERIEVAIDANRAQLVVVPYETEANDLEITVQAADHEGNVFKLYEPSNIFTYPDN